MHSIGIERGCLCGSLYMYVVTKISTTRHHHFPARRDPDDNVVMLVNERSQNLNIRPTFGMMQRYSLSPRVTIVVYLCKEDRKNAILQAAARVALDEGLAATTVRRVANAAGTAAGQVHHHFSSAAALRAEAYLLVMQNLQQSIEISSARLTPFERIQLYLIDAKDEEYIRAIRLWHEAMLLTEQDELMRAAFASSLSDWHAQVRQVIDDGRKNGDFTEGECADDIAWRLIGLSSSLDAMSRFTSLGLTEQRSAHNINRAIDIELRRSSTFEAILTQGTTG
ncbi:hypothetical protein GCM10011328_34260 [Hafnia psychrotolerans]|uniref:HTH tetR-type domain-containing protein n=2 Tax=Hafnia psychrotolerans TaxID=1477018 RepID=A0ABQ1H1X2_9GAMM|nr:hypothetical protein GCM10011328_34260 [Hafnia psychrotolerans]